MRLLLVLGSVNGRFRNDFRGFKLSVPVQFTQFRACYCWQRYIDVPFGPTDRSARTGRGESHHDKVRTGRGESHYGQVAGESRGNLVLERREV